MVGWLSGFRAQTGSVAYLQYATFVGRLGEAAAPEEGECRPCPDFASNTLAFALQLRKNHGKTSVRVTEGRSADQRRSDVSVVMYTECCGRWLALRDSKRAKQVAALRKKIQGRGDTRVIPVKIKSGEGKQSETSVE